MNDQVVEKVLLEARIRRIFIEAHRSHRLFDASILPGKHQVEETGASKLDIKASHEDFNHTKQAIKASHQALDRSFDDSKHHRDAPCASTLASAGNQEALYYNDLPLCASARTSMPTQQPPDATADEESLPPRPVRPADEDCCGNDCPTCVFTLYERDLERWEQTVADRRARRQQGRTD